ncbi:hypothetical protein [Hirschia litorea]|uniref:Lipoprotein n=1 Tax=Hirschia litorea TaxID=1199156 RepID=A0ABW2IMC9_9PROT
MKLSLGTLGLASLLVLSGCKTEYEEPTRQKVKAAMAEWASGETVADLSNLSCDNLGKAKFYCSFDITYIGSPTEKMEKCFYSSASELTIRPNTSCY